MTPGGPPRPNVLVIVLDALRADATEPYGAPEGATPTLRELARRGLAVRNVRATAPWTLPSHVAMFTGALARAVGLGQAPQGTPHGAAPLVRALRERLLAEVLRRSGYATAGVTGNLWAGKASGFDTGFERFVEINSSRQNVLGGGFLNRLKWDWEGVRAKADDGAVQAQRVLTGWARDLGTQPFFWFVNLVDCHGPYLPPSPWHGVSALTRLRVADEAHRYLTFDAILKSRLGVIKVPETALSRMREMYAASVRFADGWLGRLLAALDSEGRLGDTLVVVCSDHGENFGEDGLLTHGMSLDERLLQVPLIAAGPGAEAFTGMLSLAELPSRIAAAIELDEHPWESGLISGVAVAQWDPWELRDQRVEELRVAWKLDERALHQLRSPLTCAVQDRFKLVRGATSEEQALFDLAADPLERAPLHDEGAMAARAGEGLAALRAAVEEAAVHRTPDLTPVAARASSEELADIERRMRLMGYM